MNYACLKQQHFAEAPYEICPIRYEDMTNIKNWRNKQIDILRQNKILTDQDQEDYWSNVIEPACKRDEPNQILFSYVLNQPCPLGQGNDLSGRGLDPSHPNFEKTPPLREGSPNAFPRREDGKTIGYGGLTNIDWISKRAEVSFLMDPDRVQTYAKELTLFLKLLKRVAFDELQFHRLFTETFDMRPEHIAVLEQSGFLLEGRLKDHVKKGDRYIDSLIHGCLRK